MLHSMVVLYVDITLANVLNFNQKTQKYIKNFNISFVSVSLFQALAV